MRIIRIALLVLISLLVAIERTSAFSPNFRQQWSSTRNLIQSSSSLLRAFEEGSRDSATPEDGNILEAYENWRREYNMGDFQPDRFENFKINYRTLMAANAASLRRARQEGNPEKASLMSLNEYGDCSIEEYKSRINALREESNNASTTVAFEKKKINGVNQVNGFSQDKSQQSTTSLPKPVNGNHADINLKDTVEELDSKFEDFQEFNNSALGNTKSKDEIIRDAYMDWCKARGKPFDIKRLPIFKEHYLNAESYFEQVGKPVKLNNYADLTAEEFSLLNDSEPETTEEANAFHAGPALTETSKDSTPSIGSYLDSLGDIRTATYGEEKDLKGEDLSSLYSSINDAETKKRTSEIEEPTPLERAAEARRKAEEAARFAKEQVNRLMEEKESTLNSSEDVQEERLKAWEESRRKDAEGAKQQARTFYPTSGSYMGAVAKTWESRSEYLKSLKNSAEYMNSIKDSPEAANIEWDPITGNPIIPEDQKDQGTAKIDPLASWEDSKTDILNTADIEKTNDELSQIRQATESLERRRRDELAAQRAREEAQEWMSLQKKFEEQAKVARQRREKEEEAIEKARKKAKELEEANRERERLFKEVQAIEKQREAEEKLRAERARKAQKKEEEALRKAKRKEKRLKDKESSSDGGIFGFLFGEKTTDKDEEKIAAFEKNKQNRKEKLAQANRERNQVLDKMAKREKKAQKQKTGIPKITMWKRNDDGSISGCIENSPNYNSGSRVTTSPILGKVKPGSTVTTISGSRYNLGQAEKEEKETPMEFFQKSMNLLGSITEKKRDVALLAEWEQNEDGTITGIVAKKKGFRDGAKITTSPVQGEAKAGKVVETLGGSYYRLL